MSNTTFEFSDFVQLANADAAKNPQLVIIDGAQSGKDAVTWTNPTAGTWKTLNTRFQNAGITPAQVQVAWIKQACIQPATLGPFPIHAQKLQSYLETIAQILKTNYPNVKIAYLSSRTRAYTIDPSTINPEPFAYESGFSVQWTIADQLNGKLNYDPSKGSVVAPWLAWGRTSGQMEQTRGRMVLPGFAQTQ